MANNTSGAERETVGSWAKRCYLAGRMAMEAALRPYDLGATQWYVLHRLARDGPTMQRDLSRALHIERATLSVVIRTLVRKGLVEQMPDRVDQRQKLLRMTRAGVRLWDKLPDLRFIHKTAFDGSDSADLAAAIRVLRAATERLEKYSRQGADR